MRNFASRFSVSASVFALGATFGSPAFAQTESQQQQAQQQNTAVDCSTVTDPAEHQKCIETREFLEARGYTTPFPTGTATWRGGGLRMHADWIFVRGVKIERWGVARPLNVSDHWPIWAEVVTE